MAWLRMPLGIAGAPAWFVSVITLVAAVLDNIGMYLDDTIGSDDCPINHVAIRATKSNFRVTNPKTSRAT